MMRHFNFRLFLYLTAFLIWTGFSSAQTQAPSEVQDTLVEEPENILNPLLNLSLEELTKLTVTVTTKSELTLKETPGIVTLIAKEEIKASGARDLIDVLRLVPGLEFGVDVRGVVGLGIRGNWAHEGKVLLLWDGMALDEQLFQSMQLGYHYPVDLIDRIEIIRGPGSAIYGGEAELGVINIISVPASTLNGVEAITSFGWMKRGVGHESCQFSLGSKNENSDFYMSFAAVDAQRSDALMVDYHPENKSHSYSMKDQSPLRSVFINAGFSASGLEAKLLIDKYFLNDRSMYGVNLPSAPDINFYSYVFDLSYNSYLNQNTQLIPRLTYTQNTPWQCIDKNYRQPVYLDKWAEKYSAGISLQSQLHPNINLLSGFEFNYYAGRAADSSFYLRDPSRKTIDNNNFAVFGQALYSGSPGNFTLGARWETNSKAGNSFVPRIAFTKVIDNFHVKALYSYAYRSPSIENISRYILNPVKSEKTRVSELELGYQLSPSFYISGNIFSILINDPIIFSVDPATQTSGYHNGPRTGTMGFEADLRFKNHAAYCTITYSHYSARDNQVLEYQVTSDEDYMLGFARHKITFNSSFILFNKFVTGLSGTFLTGRYYDIDVTKTQIRSDSKMLLNLFTTYRNFLKRGFDLGVGVYDILNVNYAFIQPYNGGTAPLPGPTREIILKISYQTDF